MKKNYIFITFILLFFNYGLIGFKTFSQNSELNSDVKHDLVNKIIYKLKAAYIFPETALQMETFLLKNLEEQKYEKITDSKEFSYVLTDDLRTISKDKHLHIDYFPEAIPKEKSDPEDLSPVELERIREFEKSSNYGFGKVKILKGNIGYIELKSFLNPAHATEITADVFNFIANTKALIIDLRKNEGGNPYMVQLICSYLVNENIHLNSIYWRYRQTTDEFFTLSYLKGKRYLDKEVYLLTSKNTFSAAEEFAYNLHALKRAVIIGEITAGGAHPGNFVKLTEYFGMFLPMGESINPITKTNWEGIGVIPDIQTLGENALKVAKKQITNNK